MKLIQIFKNTDLRGGHKWLAEIAKNHRLNVADLKPGQMVVFVNRAQTQMKTYAAGNSIVHTKKVGRGQRIDMETIKFLPMIFDQNGIDYNEALKRRLKKFWIAPAKQKASERVVH